jgi:hypothetical protein
VVAGGRGLKRSRGKNACRKNGEASDAAVAAPGPYRPPPTLTHAFSSPLSFSLSSVFAAATTTTTTTTTSTPTPMTSKRFHARTRPSVHPSVLCCRASSLAPSRVHRLSLWPGVCSTATPKCPRIFDLGGLGV